MKKQLHRAQDRGATKTDWLDSKHSFSFGEDYDEEANGFGDLLVLNDDIIQPKTGFGRHAHANMEIISIVLEGILQHKDNMGNTSTISKGEVQVMSAGTGVQHAEVNPSTTEPVNLLQIWIRPNQVNVKPRYDQKQYTLKKNMLTTVVSGEKDKARLYIHQDASLSLLELDKGKKNTYILNVGRGVYIFVIDGTARIEKEKLDTKDAIALSDIREIEIEATKDTKILMIEVNMNNTQEH